MIRNTTIPQGALDVLPANRNLESLLKKHLGDGLVSHPAGFTLGAMLRVNVRLLDKLRCLMNPTDTTNPTNHQPHQLHQLHQPHHINTHNKPNKPNKPNRHNTVDNVNQLCQLKHVYSLLGIDMHVATIDVGSDGNVDALVVVPAQLVSLRQLVDKPAWLVPAIRRLAVVLASSCLAVRHDAWLDDVAFVPGKQPRLATLVVMPSCRLVQCKDMKADAAQLVEAMTTQACRACKTSQTSQTNNARLDQHVLAQLVRHQVLES